MKISRFFALCLCIVVSCNKSFAATEDGFFFVPFLTVEYSAPRVSSGGDNSKFKTDNIFKQILAADNFALGMHGRIHKYVGFNVNLAKTDLSSAEMQNYALEKKAEYALSYANFSTMFFMSLIEDDRVEIFAELGASDMQSKISISQTNGDYTKKHSHQTMAFYGAGFQFLPFESSNDAIRMSFLRYVEKIPLLDANLTVVRLGYIKSF